jgi:NADH-quinone oxidoreductase subunit N
MSSADLWMLSPIAILNFGAVAVMLLLAVRRSETLVRALTFAIFLLALGALWQVEAGLPYAIAPLFTFDALGLFYMALVIGASLVVATMAQGYIDRSEHQPEEFYILLLLAAAGGAIMCVAGHMVSFYLGLEILSVSLYGMVAYNRQSRRGSEAALKYLLLAGVSAAFFLFGVALVYAQVGSMELAEMASAMAEGADDNILRAGLGLMLVGVAFKLSLVPFQVWAPDVYEGSPTPVAAFLSTVSKTAMVALVARIYLAGADGVYDSLQVALAAVAVATMLGGNLLAFRQSNIKRLLAYSSSAQMGYAMVPLVVGGAFALHAVSVYLLVYTLTSLAAFGVVAVLTAHPSEASGESQVDLRGLLWRSPWLATILGIALLSLAGMPFTAGFIGKFLLVRAGAGGAAYVSLAALVIGSLIGAFYYLRVIAQICAPVPADAAVPDPAARPIPALSFGILALLALGLLWLGLYPAPVLDSLEALLAAR